MEHRSTSHDHHERESLEEGWFAWNRGLIHLQSAWSNPDAPRAIHGMLAQLNIQAGTRGPKSQTRAEFENLFWISWSVVVISSHNPRNKAITG